MTADISALPTPPDYMAFLCERFLVLWMPWQKGQKVTPDMELALKDLARPASKFRKKAQDLRRAVENSETEVEDPDIRMLLDLLLSVSKSDLTDACDIETQYQTPDRPQDP